MNDDTPGIISFTLSIIPTTKSVPFFTALTSLTLSLTTFSFLTSASISSDTLNSSSSTDAFSLLTVKCKSS